MMMSGGRAESQLECAPLSRSAAQRPVLRPPPGAAGGDGSGRMYPPAAAPLPADGNELRADSSSRTGMRRESWLVADHI